MSGALSARQALALAQASLAERPLLIVSDFDGTLSHIVLDPWGASILPTARRALRRLAGLPGVTVALLSGRTAADVAARARVGGALYLGNHGLERAYLARRGRAEALAVTRAAEHDGYEVEVERIASSLPGLIPEPWLVIERKAPAVAFHFRGAPDVDAAAERVAQAVQQLDPDGRFVRYPGRRVLELRPPGAVAKGGALRAVLDELRPRAAFMLGDDRSDAEAFVVLRQARDAGELHGLALAVQARAEVPPEVVAAADAVLASPVEAARFLDGLAWILRPSPAAASRRA